jgi:hypothetical protein
LAKSLKHDKIYAIDDDSAYIPLRVTGFKPHFIEAYRYVRKALKWPFKLPDELEVIKKEHLAYCEASTGESILEKLKYMNTDEWTYHQHAYQFIDNTLDADTGYAGSMWFGSYYTRNLRIFSHIQKLCKTSECICVIYGAGHLHILREFINNNRNMELISLGDILRG